jgi:hypothetical protein
MAYSNASISTEYIAILRNTYLNLDNIIELGKVLSEMVRGLDDWLRRTFDSNIGVMRCFAVGIERDCETVNEVLSLR